MTQRSRLNSGRVPVTLPTNVTSDRYQFLGLDSAEPNLGTSGSGNVLTTNASGARIWTNNVSIAKLTTTGDITVGGNINVTGNVIQYNITGNSGQFFGNINGFGALYAGIGTGYTIEPQTTVQISSNYNGYAQLEQQNINNGTQATTDYVATSGTGNNTTYYVDLGIAGGGYDGTNPNNSLGTSLLPNDSYLYSQGNVSAPGQGGNLVIGTTIPGTITKIIAGGINSANIVATFSNTGLTVIGNVTGGGIRQTTSSTPPSSPSVGDQWYDTSTDILFQFEFDGTNYVWVDISSTPLNTNVAIITSVQLSVTGNASVATNLAVGGSMTINNTNQPSAIINGGTSGQGNIGSISNTFNTVFAKASTAQYADLAELYSSDQPYDAGTVVVFAGSAEITQSTTNHDTKVAGVISTNPAYLMNNSINGLPVALQGRVPCRVQGPINKGELVVTSDIPGVAQRLDETKWRPGCVIGKSLEQINHDSIVTIEIVVGRD